MSHESLFGACTSLTAVELRASQFLLTRSHCYFITTADAVAVLLDTHCAFNTSQLALPRDNFSSAIASTIQWCSAK